MSVQYKARVWEVGTITGSGPYNLPNTANGGAWRTFAGAALASGSKVVACIQDTVTNAWELSLWTYTAGSPGTLARAQFLESSTGSAVTFAGNSCNVTLEIPSPAVLSTGAASSGLVPVAGTLGVLDSSWLPSTGGGLELIGSGLTLTNVGTLDFGNGTLTSLSGTSAEFLAPSGGGGSFELLQGTNAQTGTVTVGANLTLSGSTLAGLGLEVQENSTLVSYGINNVNFTGPNITLQATGTTPSIVQSLPEPTGGTSLFPSAVTPGNYICALLYQGGLSTFAGLPLLVQSGSGFEAISIFGEIATSSSSPTFSNSSGFIAFELAGVQSYVPNSGTVVGSNPSYEIVENITESYCLTLLGISANSSYSGTETSLAPSEATNVLSVNVIGGVTTGGFVVEAPGLPNGSQVISWSDTTVPYVNYASVQFVGIASGAVNISVGLPVKINGTLQSYSANEIFITTNNTVSSASVSNTGTLIINLGTP